MELNLRLFEGVAFDFDGTLADTYHAHMLAREYAFKKHGITGITEEQNELGHRHGNNPTTIIAGVLKTAGKIPADADPYTDPLVSAIVETKNQHYSELGKDGLDAMPGAVELFLITIKLYGRDKVAITTTAPLLHVRPFLKRYDLQDALDDSRLITEDTATEQGFATKPDPGIYVYANKLMMLPADKLLVIEDSTGGVISGKEAGCPVLAVGSTNPRDIFYADSVKQHPDYFAVSLSEVHFI